ncbi:MAG: AsmA-like C-terminal region-containing protein [Candidatus Omnitrophica bacterium]|nr:AsmA-like C-terminal region-containing protein [Candidatus Omnitrophota bacterium]
MMKKIVLIGLVVIIGLIGITFIYLNYVYIPKHLKPMVIKFLEENLGKRVIVGKAFYFPLKGVLFSKVEIANSDQTPFLEVNSVDFGLKSIPSIKKNAFSAKLKLVIKGLMFKQQALEARGGCAIDLDINIKAKEEMAFSAIAELNDINVMGIKETGEITKIQGRIICSQSSFESENISATIGAQILKVQIAGDYDKKDVIINKFNINYIDTNLSIKGKVSGLANPQIDFSLEGLIKLKDIAGMLSGIPLPALVGDCKITAECKGAPVTLKTLSADAKILLNKALVDKIKVANLKTDIKLENGALNIASLDCDFYSGKITGEAKAIITDKDIPVQCSIDAQDIDIEPLVEDLIGRNMGQGVLNAHVEISGSAADLNLLNGTGWVKVIEGKVKMPPNFAKVANSLGVAKLSDMNIEEASATFTLSDGKLQTNDLIMIAAEAAVSGSGYIDLEQYVDFEATFEAGTNLPLPKVKVYDRLSQLKYKLIFPTQDLIKTGIKNLLNKDREGQSGGSDIQDQLKKGLEKLFR